MNLILYILYDIIMNSSQQYTVYSTRTHFIDDLQMNIPKLAMTYYMTMDGPIREVTIEYMSRVIASYKFVEDCDNFILPFRMNDKYPGHEVIIKIRCIGSCTLDIHYDVYDEWINTPLACHPAFRHSIERFDTSNPIHLFNKHCLAMKNIYIYTNTTHWGV